MKNGEKGEEIEEIKIKDKYLIVPKNYIEYYEDEIYNLKNRLEDQEMENRAKDETIKELHKKLRDKTK